MFLVVWGPEQRFLAGIRPDRWQPPCFSTGTATLFNEMSELQEQLAALRARMAQVLEEVAQREPVRAAALKPRQRPRSASEAVVHADDFSITDDSSSGMERDWAGAAAGHQGVRQGVHPYVQSSVHACPLGEEIVTAHGKHFESETFYPGHLAHGSADVGALCELPADFLHILSDGAIRDVPVEQWVFLDTETTGLAGGTGTCAFLVGVGRITRDGFRVRQFFMRDFAEEASALDALARHLEPFRVLITYNGRTFDQPLLETRYRLNRTPIPFARMQHLDLLYGARRLWKLRYDSCRLVELEQQVLGFERQGDVPGAQIPELYFEYLRSGEMDGLGSVFYHNALDILTLGCLTGIVPHAFQPSSSAGLKHASEMAGIARWLRQSGELQQACDLFHRAVTAGLPDELLFRTLWDIGLLERKLGRHDCAVTAWEELAGNRNAFQAKALEALAKHHEHRTKNRALALEYTRQALVLSNSVPSNSDPLRKREQRLTKRLRLADKSRE